jgi:hypothetical protein
MMRESAGLAPIRKSDPGLLLATRAAPKERSGARFRALAKLRA